MVDYPAKARHVRSPERTDGVICINDVDVEIGVLVTFKQVVINSDWCSVLRDYGTVVVLRIDR